MPDNNVEKLSDEGGKQFTIQPKGSFTKVAVSFWMRSGARFTYEADAVHVVVDEYGTIESASIQNGDSDLVWLNVKEIEAITKDV
jgi:hypothetical protein